mgnify:FL=1
MSLLSVRRLSKTYPGQNRPAVEDVSFSLRKGEVFGLVGESGSGKSTLLRLLAGLDDPDGGLVRISGKPMAGPKDRLVPGHPDVRLVHQDFRLLPNVRVEENITYALRGYDAAYREARLNAVLQLCDLQVLRHQMPRQLSGGEAQRVALACALADEPALLLLDEPFSNLDPLRRIRLKRDLAGIVRRSGTTAVFVTHDTADALSLSDKVGVLHQGRLLQTAPPHEIYNRPATVYVAAFFGHANVTLVSSLQKIARRPGVLSRFGLSASLCVRAEHVRFCKPPEADFAARPLATHYLGAYSLHEVRLAPGVVWQVSAPPDFGLPKSVFLQVDWEKVSGLAG